MGSIGLVNKKISVLPIFGIVFMSPELATEQPWRELFSSSLFRGKLVLVAVDEAHCVTEWYVWDSF